MAAQLKKTVKPSGGDYTTLEACLNANEQDLTAADKYFDVEIDGDWSGGADTSAVTVHNYVTDATRYINIYSAAAARHSGVWNAGKYILAVSNNWALTISANFFRCDGLQISISSINAHYRAPLYVINIATGGSGIWVSNSILKCANNASFRGPGLFCDDADATVYIWNCVVYNLTAAASGDVCLYFAAATAWYVYSCTLIGGYSGIVRDGGTGNLKNTYCCGTDPYVGYITNHSYNASSIAAELSGTGEINSVAKDTDTFVNVTAGSEDFHLAADDASPLQGVGTNTSGESAPLNFTTDIAGNTRDSTWDMGAFCDVAGGPTHRSSGPLPLFFRDGLL